LSFGWSQTVRKDLKPVGCRASYQYENLCLGQKPLPAKSEKRPFSHNMTKSAFWSRTKLQIGHVSATADLASGKPLFSKYVSTFVWLPAKPAEQLHRLGQIRDFSDNRSERITRALRCNDLPGGGIIITTRYRL
jgi:hypothetical protein